MTEEPVNQYYDGLNEIDNIGDLGELPYIKNLPRKDQRIPPRKKSTKRSEIAHDDILAELAEQADDVSTFKFTYKAARHEHDWLIDSLGGFYEQQWIDDVLRMIKGGKEASVYQCSANQSTLEDFIAAKVYRPRRFRNLKNDHLYREGRARLDSDGAEIFDHGILNAMNKRTEYGLRMMHTSWMQHEFQTMKILHASGADIPVPYACDNNAILMSYIGGVALAAPTMNQINLDLDESNHLYRRVIENVEIMLANDRIHGDLSAYNILYWDGDITIIDFPQAISPEENRSAFAIFERDLARICKYFALQGVDVKPRSIAADMWTSHRHRLTPDIHPGLLDDQDADDLAYWKSISNPDEQ
jgi:RIO kinase 1